MITLYHLRDGKEKQGEALLSEAAFEKVFWKSKARPCIPVITHGLYTYAWQLPTFEAGQLVRG